jgi:hypothetical protein
MLTEPVDAPVWEQPFVRDLDGHIYVRGYRDRLLVGAFEPDGKPRASTVDPADFAFAEFEPDLAHVAEPLARARERVPMLREAAVERHMNAPESFTPDNLPLVGEVPEVAGVFVAAGMNSQGILLGPGLGQAVASGSAREARRRTWPSWPRRASPTPRRRAATSSRARARASGRLYAMHWPHHQPATARGLRRTPLHHRLEAAGLLRGGSGLGARELVRRARHAPEYAYSYERPPWFDRVALEHRAAARRWRSSTSRRSPSSRWRAAVPCRGPAGVRRRPGRAGRQGRVHDDAQSGRRHRDRPHGHPPGRRPLPRRGARGDPAQGAPLARAPRGGSRRHGDGHHLRVRDARLMGPAPARSSAG